MSSAWTHHLVVFLFRAAFPRLAYRLRWPTRLRGWPLVAYVAFSAMVRFSLLELARSIAEYHRAERQILRDKLGREPTDEDWRAHLEAAGVVPPSAGPPPFRPT